MNFPLEMKSDRAAVAARSAAHRGERFLSAFEKGFDFLTARFVFFRHAAPPGDAPGSRAFGYPRPPSLSIKHQA
jgi:hypothetical protein